MTQIERRARSSGPDVLIVDDEDDIREPLELTLLRLGRASDGAATLAEARQLLGERRYRLCLTDMRLPDGDGLELVRYISENVRDLPVAVITAFGSMDNAVTALKAGAFDYLSKPVVRNHPTERRNPAKALQHDWHADPAIVRIRGRQTANGAELLEVVPADELLLLEKKPA